MAYHYAWTAQPTIADLIARAAEAGGVECELLTRPRRAIRARRPHRALLATIKVARECHYPLTRIGERLGGRHHTTILTHQRAAEQLEARDHEFAALVKRVRGGAPEQEGQV